MADGKITKFSRNARIGLSFLIVAVIVLISVGVTFAILPNFATVDTSKAPKVVAIIPENKNNEIDVDADIKKVFVSVKYSDGSVKSVPISELITSGLETSKPGTLKNVELVYGGFKQYVTFNVVPTKLVVKYTTPSGGGRVEGQKTQEIDPGRDASTVRAIPDEGFVFVEWSDGNPNPTRTDKKIKASVEYIATFARKELIVVFQYPDGTLSRERIIEYGKSAENYAPRVEENQMQLYGYKFSHWDKDITYITEDLTFIPVYEKHATNIHLSITERDGEPFAKVEQPEDFGKKALPYFPKEKAATLRLKANGGRMFTGWSIRDRSGVWHEIPLNSGDESTKIEVGNGDNGYVDFYTPIGTTADEFQIIFTPSLGAEDIYIRANLIYEQPLLSFYSFGEPVIKNNQNLNIVLNNKLSQTIGDVVRESLGDKFIYSDNLLTAKGYVFEGWEYKTNDGESHLITEDNYAYLQFDQDTKINAIWKVGTYDVIFKREGNEDPDFVDIEKGYDTEKDARVLKVKYQDNLKNIQNNGVFPNPAVREDYTFIGWFTDTPEGRVSVTLNTVLNEEGLIVYPGFVVNEIDVNVNTTGSGKAYKNLVDSNGDLYLGPEVLGTVKCDVVSSHTFSLIANDGYYISSLKVNDEVIEVTPGTQRYDLTFSSPKENKNVSVSYTMFNSTVNLTNGDSNINGKIEYLNDIDDANSDVEVGESVIITSYTATIPVQRNTTKVFSIEAPQNYSIFNILVNGYAVTGLPSNVSTFKLELEIGAEDINIAIIYEVMQHIVEVITPLDQMENGAISIYEGVTDKGLSARFNKGVEDVFINVEANVGYYIKSVRVNGYILNPYAKEDILTNKYLPNNVKVNYLPANINLTDSRVSGVRYRVRSLREDLAIDVEFEKMYYKISSSSIGQGTVEHKKEVPYGEKVYITGKTTENNYVYKINANSVVISPSTSESSYTHTIDSIKEDYNVIYEFAPRTYGVTFAANQFLTVTYENTTYDLTTGKTFDKIHRGANLVFTLNAKENYEIQIVRYKQRGTDTYDSMPIPYNTTEYEIKIDNISNSYEYVFHGEGSDEGTIIDGIVKRNSNWSIKAITGETSPPNVTIDGQQIYFSAYEFVATGISEYGNALSIVVAPGNGYRVRGLASQDGLPEDLSFAKIINATNPSEEYLYYPIENEMPQGLSYSIEKNDDVSYTLLINNVSSDLEIILSFEKVTTPEEPYKITFKSEYKEGEVKKGTVQAWGIFDGNEDGLISGGDLPSDGTVKYVLKPEENYAVKALIINGLIIESYNYVEAEAGLERTITYTANSDHDVEVVFIKQKSQITIEENEEDKHKGLISSNLEFYSDTDVLLVKVTPKVGYEISKITVEQLTDNGFSYTITENTIKNDIGYINTGVYEFEVGSGSYAHYLEDDVLVKAEFSPKKYTLSIIQSGDGDGLIALFKGLDLVEHGIGIETDYDEIYNLRLTPTGDSYIKSITINGFEYDSEAILINGEYSFKISGDNNINVKFDKKQYSLRLNRSLDGVVNAQVHRDGYPSEFLPIDKVKLYSTDSITIDAKSNYGFNIKAVKINSAIVWQNTNPSLIYTHRQSDKIRVLDYIVSGQTIIDIEIEFEINNYTIKLEAINTSPNFRDIDIKPSDFGTISISGRQINSEQIYLGFMHGSNVRVNLRPRVARGYYISKLSIKYTNAELGIQDLTSEILNDENDSYLIRNLQCNVEYVRVEYKRRIYSVEYTQNLNPLEELAKFPFTGSPMEVYPYNPYDREKEVFLDDGRYEYGLSYEIPLDPGVGYERSEFYINGVDRNYSVRANTFRGVVIGDVVANSLFSIKQYKIILDYQITEDRTENGNLQYDEDGNIKYRGMYGEVIVEDADTGSIIWNISKYHLNDTKDIESGTVTIGFDVEYNRPYILATHNTRLKYRIIPNFDDSGYKITNILRGNSTVSLPDPESEYFFNDNTKETFSLSVSFEKSKYIVRYEMATNITNSSISLSETEVLWDGSVTINIVVDKGSYLSKLDYAKSLTSFDIVDTIFAYDSQLPGTADGSYVVHPPDSAGMQHISYTLSSIKTPISFRVEITRNKYDISVEKEYNISHDHNAETYKAGIEIVTNDNSRNAIYLPNTMYSSNRYGTEIPNSLEPVPGSQSNLARVKKIDAYGYIGLSDADTVMIYLQAPNGYDINSIQVTMEDLGGIVSYLINGPNDPNIIRDTLYGYRIGIERATGNINISVTYKIRTYQLKQEVSQHGGYSANTTTAAIKHHDEFEVEILADFGYRLQSFYINNVNRTNNVSSTKTLNNQYQYSTTVRGIKARINDSFTSKDANINSLNNYEIPLTSSFTTLKYNIEIYVREGDSIYRLIGSPEISMIDIDLQNVQVIYDPSYVGYNFHHILQEGVEVKSIGFYNQNRNNPGAGNSENYYYIRRNDITQVDLVDDFTKPNPKYETLETVGNNLLNILDFHNPDKNKIFVYYDVAIKNFNVKTYFRYISSSGTDDYGYESRGMDVFSIPNANIQINSTDNKQVMPVVDGSGGSIHNYGTKITYTTSVEGENVRKVQFAGFQEEVSDGVWEYIELNSAQITGSGNNQTLSIIVKSNRSIRVVFYQVFVVNVVIMPSFQPSGSPNENNFARYDTNLKAYASYDETESNGRILPYVENPIVEPRAEGDDKTFISEELRSINPGANKINYEFLVKSGAVFRVSAASNLAVDYYIAKPGDAGRAYSEEKKDELKMSTPAKNGYEVNKNLLINASTNRSGYALISRKSLGAEANAGASIKYKIGDNEYPNLTAPYIKVDGNATLEITITVNPNFRFDELTYKATANSSDGRLIFGEQIQMKSGDDEGRTTVSYKDANGATIQPPQNVSEKQQVKSIVIRTTNYSIIKSMTFSFVKRIRVYKYALLYRNGIDEPSAIEDGTVKEIDGLANRIVAGEYTSSSSQYFDFNQELTYQLTEAYQNIVADMYRRPVQFVGFSINGVNFEKNLASQYPDPTGSTTIKLNDLDATLSNGVRFVYEADQYNVNPKEYIVRIVARFIPLVNVLVENTYESTTDEFVDAGSIGIRTTKYSEEGLSINESIEIVNSQYMDTQTNEIIYTNKLLKVPATINSSINSSESAYNIWKDNIINLSWLSENDRKSIAFVCWEYFAYNPNSVEKGEWIPIPYTKEVNGRLSTSKDSNYSFPLSAILPQYSHGTSNYRPYHYYVKSDGTLKAPGDFAGDFEEFMGMPNIAKYDVDGNVIPGDFFTNIPVLRIRPKYEKRIYLEIAPYLATDVENQYNKVNVNSFGNLVNPSIGDSGLFNQSVPINRVVLLKHNTIKEKFIFGGWYYRPLASSTFGEVLEFKLDNTLTHVPIPGTSETREITYIYLETIADRDRAIDDGLLPQSARFGNFETEYKDCIVMKLDWPDGDYLIAAQYTRVYEIQISVKNESGAASNILNKSRLELDYYGLSSSVPGAATWEELVNESSEFRRYDEFSITIKVPAGKLALFKLNTQYSAIGDQIYNDFVFNPNYDEYSGISVFANGNLSTNVWMGGSSSDYSFSKEVIQPNTPSASDVAAIRNAKYAILGNADKIVEVRVKSFGNLTIHNVFEGAEVKLPTALANVLGIPGGLVKDNDGNLDKDNELGIIKLEKIPIMPDFDIDGKNGSDYGIKITRFLTGQRVLASTIFQHDVTLNSNDSKLRKEQHIVLFGEKNISVWNNNSEELDTILLGKNIERPFEGGDGSAEHPFIIKSTYQFHQIESLYVGNENTLFYLDNGFRGKFNFKLANDINLSDQYNPITQPLCSDGVLGFNGVLNGDGHMLYGLSLERGDSVGLFKILTSGAEIRNLTISAKDVTSTNGFSGFFAPQVESQDLPIIIENISSSEDSNYKLGAYTGNFAGVLVGKVSSSSSIYAGFELRNINLAGAQVFSNLNKTDAQLSEYEGKIFAGSTLISVKGTGADGAAGGAVGMVVGKTTAKNITLDNISVSCTMNNGRFAGGFIGISDSLNQTPAEYSNITVKNPRVQVSKNFAGGIFAVLGSGQNLIDSVVEVTTSEAEVTSGEIARFRETPNNELYKSAGVGGFVGVNQGTITRPKFKGNGIYTLNSGVVGGVVGYNEGGIVGQDNNLIEDSTIKLRSEIKSERIEIGNTATVMGGGIFGGVVGWNTNFGSVTDIEVNGKAYAGYGTVFAENAAFYEVAYESRFTSDTTHYRVKGNMQTHAPNGDITTVYIAGIIGYNSQGAVAHNLRFATKLSAYREIDGNAKSKTFINAISNVNKGTKDTGEGAYLENLGRIEYMKVIIADNETPTETATPEPAPIPFNREQSIDEICALDPSTGETTHVRYLTLGTYYVKGRCGSNNIGYNGPNGDKEYSVQYSRAYNHAEASLITKAETTLDVVVNYEIYPKNNADYEMNYYDASTGLTENLAVGYIVKARGSWTTFTSYNYTGHIRQTVVERQNVS